MLFIFILQVGFQVDMSDMVPYFERNVSLIHDMIDALQCIKAQGIKTALLTNNWKHQEEEKTVLPVDRKLFNVVSFLDKLSSSSSSDTVHKPHLEYNRTSVVLHSNVMT